MMEPADDAADDQVPNMDIVPELPGWVLARRSVTVEEFNAFPIVTHIQMDAILYNAQFCMRALEQATMPSLYEKLINKTIDEEKLMGATVDFYLVNQMRLTMDMVVILPQIVQDGIRRLAEGDAYAVNMTATLRDENGNVPDQMPASLRDVLIGQD